MLAIPVIIIICVFVFSLSWLAIIVIRQKHILGEIKQAIESANENDIDEVYAAVARAGEGVPNAYILGKTNLRELFPEHCLSLPEALDYFPWAGKVVHIDTRDRVTMTIESEADENRQIRLAGDIYALVPVPMADNETGQGYPMFSPYKWLTGNNRLLDSLRKISPRYPQQVLSYLITPGENGYAYEPDHQVRIGAGIAWVRKPEVPVCDICEERMRFILQCPGTLLDGTAEREAIYYLFGCKLHPENIHLVTQYR